MLDPLLRRMQISSCFELADRKDKAHCSLKAERYSLLSLPPGPLNPLEVEPHYNDRRSPLDRRWKQLELDVFILDIDESFWPSGYTASQV
jgi:hypothetical protein